MANSSSFPLQMKQLAFSLDLTSHIYMCACMYTHTYIYFYIIFIYFKQGIGHHPFSNKLRISWLLSLCLSSRISHPSERPPWCPLLLLHLVRVTRIALRNSSQSPIYVCPPSPLRKKHEEWPSTNTGTRWAIPSFHLLLPPGLDAGRAAKAGSPAPCKMNPRSSHQVSCLHLPRPGLWDPGTARCPAASSGQATTQPGKTWGGATELQPAAKQHVKVNTQMQRCKKKKFYSVFKKKKRQLKK